LSIFADLFAKILEFWHKTLSLALPHACRFEPTCSMYAAEALRTHGFMRGSWLALLRLARCHPWGSYGFDPVPVKFARRIKD
jgi:putative membrane protein insertion efficiency factor